MRKMMFLAGAATGYVLGARAGREQYTKIQEFAKKAAEAPQMQHAKEIAEQAAGKVTEKVTAMAPGGKTSEGDTASNDTTSNDGAELPVQGGRALNGSATRYTTTSSF